MTVERNFDPVLTSAGLLRGCGFPWFVSGGWAIDLFLGHVTREHADVEIGIYRADQRALREHLSDFELQKCIQTPSGGQWVQWEQDEDLTLPIHQILAKPRQADQREFEFFLNERTETHWLSRRHSGLMCPLKEVAFISPLGIPALAPEIQLLFKAKYVRPKDQADFEAALPRMNSARQVWLLNSLRQYHPGHAWITAIEAK